MRLRLDDWLMLAVAIVSYLAGVFLLARGLGLFGLSEPVVVRWALGATGVIFAISLFAGAISAFVVFITEIGNRLIDWVTELEIKEAKRK